MMNILQVFLVLLNYFWLSDDPVECASWYCDQHCFKIGSEVMESVWDAVSVLCPRLESLATKQGISTVNRKHRHAGEDMLWHPFTVWNGFCRENMRVALSMLMQSLPSTSVALANLIMLGKTANFLQNILTKSTLTLRFGIVGGCRKTVLPTLNIRRPRPSQPNSENAKHGASKWPLHIAKLTTAIHLP